MSRKLLQEFRTAHAAYEIDLAAEKEEKCEDIVRCELSKANKEKEDFEKKKSELKQKQKEADAHIAEANEHLIKVTTSQNMTDVLAAQALPQSGTNMLLKVRKEQDETEEPAKKKKKLL